MQPIVRRAIARIELVQEGRSASRPGFPAADWAGAGLQVEAGASLAVSPMGSKDH